jgi:hypothetical protein
MMLVDAHVREKSASRNLRTEEKKGEHLSVIGALVGRMHGSAVAPVASLAALTAASLPRRYCHGWPPEKESKKDGCNTRRTQEQGLEFDELNTTG